MQHLPQLEDVERRKLEEALLRLARPGVHGQLRVEFEMVPVTVHKLKLNLKEKLSERLGLSIGHYSRESGNLIFPQDDRGRSAAQFLRDFNLKLEDTKLFALVANIKDG